MTASTAPVVLATGFEPFDGAPTNTSQLVLDRLPGPRHTALITEVLPVSFHRAPAQLAQLLANRTPDYVILLGQSSRIGTPQLELVAHNIMDSTAPDADNYWPHHVPISSSGPPTMPTTLDVAVLQEAAANAGHELRTSIDPGAFVCNALFYTCQQLLARTDTPSGLIHVPAVNEPAEVDALVDLIETVLDALCPVVATARPN